MSSNEEVLSLDLEETDLLYRIRRDRRIVYVSVQDLEVIPPQDRTDSFRILSRLRRAPVWNQSWGSLSIIRQDGIRQYVLDAFRPHALAPSELFVHCKTSYNLLDFKNLDRLTDRLSSTMLGGKESVIKIARFKHELPYLRNEIRSYSLLINSNFQNMPKFLGYVYESEPSRVVGFIMERLTGIHPALTDLDNCRAVLQQIHDIGLVHGDANKYNWIKTDQGLKIFDFEAATQIGDAEITPDAEIAALPAMLSDMSRFGWHGTST